jgi:hypothetical protein
MNLQWPQAHNVKTQREGKNFAIIYTLQTRVHFAGILTWTESFFAYARGRFSQFLLEQSSKAVFCFPAFDRDKKKVLLFHPL